MKIRGIIGGVIGSGIVLIGLTYWNREREHPGKARERAEIARCFASSDDLATGAGDEDGGFKTRSQLKDVCRKRARAFEALWGVSVTRTSLHLPQGMTDEKKEQPNPAVGSTSWWAVWRTATPA